MTQHKDETVLSVKNVTKEFYLPHNNSNSLKESITQVFKKKDKGGDEYKALKDISFEVKKGDFFGVVGRNGAGKSTLLRILAEIYRPTTGSVYVKGNLVPFIELGVGFNNNLTGRQNVFLNGAMLGFSKREMNARYDEIVQFAELEKFMDQKLKNYSSGMRVRLAFSVAIQADADILLLDEVLAVGDANFKKKCFAYFDKLKENKKTIIFVSHSMGAVRDYCNKAILIEEGRITAQGDAEKVADEYMKLFANKDEHANANKDADRSGSRKVYMDNFELSKTDNKLNIKTSLVCGDKPARSVHIKVEIKNRQGRVVGAFSNLSIDNGSELNFESNEVKALEFNMENIYKGGTYNITAIVAENEDVEVFDEWRNVTTFSSYDEEAPYQIVNPGTLTISKQK